MIGGRIRAASDLGCHSVVCILMQAGGARHACQGRAPELGNAVFPLESWKDMNRLAHARCPRANLGAELAIKA